MSAAAVVTAPDPTTIPLGSPSDHDDDGGGGEGAPSSDLSSLSSLDTSPPPSMPPPVRSSSPDPASTSSSASSSSSSAGNDDDEAAAPPSPIPPTSSTPPSLASLPSRLSAAAALSSPSPPPLPATTTTTTMSTVAASAAAAAASEAFPSTPPHSTSMSRNLYPHRENHGIISGFLFRKKSNSSSNSNSDVNKSSVSGNEAGSDSSSSNSTSNKATNILSSPPSPLAQRSIDFGQLQGRAAGVDLSSSVQAMRASDEDDEDEQDARAVSGFLSRLATTKATAPATPSPAPSASKTADPQLPPPPLIALATEEDEVAAPAAAPLKPDLDDHARADPIDQPLDATTSAYNDDFLAPFLPNAPAHAPSTTSTTTTATATFAPPPLSLSASASTSTWWSSLPSSSTFGHRSSASTGVTGSMSSLASAAAAQSCEPLALSLSMLGEDGGPKKGVVGEEGQVRVQGPAEVDRSLAASVEGDSNSGEDAPPQPPLAEAQQPTGNEGPAADTPSNSSDDAGNVDAPPSPQRLIVHAEANDSIQAATGTGAVMINTTTTTTNTPASSRPTGQIDGPGDVVVDRPSSTHHQAATISAPSPSPSPFPSDGLNIPQLIAEAVRTVLADLTVERSEEEEKRKRDAKQLLALLREEMVKTAEEAVARGGREGRKKGAEDEGVKESKVAVPVSATHHHQVDARAMLDLLDERAERVRTVRLLSLVIISLLVALAISGTTTWRLLQQQQQLSMPSHAGFFGVDEGAAHTAWSSQQQHHPKVRPYHHLDEAPGDPVFFGPQGGSSGGGGGDTSGSTWTSRMRLG